MIRFRAAVQIVFAALTVLLVMMQTGAHAQETQAGDYARVTGVPREAMDKWLKEEVAKSGGDWDNGRYSLYIGFATGHYSSDPTSAIAMRRLAFGLMNNSLAVGDKVTSVAFEMRAYQFGDSITLTEDPESRKQFVNSVAYAAEADSKGGHDIERALCQTVQKIPESEYGSSIVLLLNKDNASQAPQGENVTLFGQNNGLLLAAINKGEFRSPPERKVFQWQSGASSLTVAITALFPKKLVSLPGTFGPRYPTFPMETWQPAGDRPAAAEAPNPVKPAQTGPTPPNTAGGTPAAPTRSGTPWWVWLVLLLVVAGVILFLVLGKRSGVQRPLQAVPAAVTPKLETLPGSLRVTIGPDEQTISPLTKGASWALARKANGSVTLTDLLGATVTKGTGAASSPGASPPAPVNMEMGTPLAKLTLSDDRSLRVEADSGAQFAELQGTAADRSDSRALIIEPGKRLLCRVQPPDAGTKTRFEIVYDTGQGKGTKV